MNLSANELIELIYEDNLSHFEFMENMNGGDCDCFHHLCLNLMASYMGIEVDA